MATWKPENPAEPWKTSDYVRERHIRRVAGAQKKIKKYGKAYVRKFGKPAEKLNKGPCIPTEILVHKPSLARRIFKGEKKRFRIVPGLGHRLAGFDRWGNRVWHPRHADIKMCLVCRRTFIRTTATKPGQGVCS